MTILQKLVCSLMAAFVVTTGIAGCATPSVPPLRLLTCNIHHGADVLGVYRLGAVIEAIRRSRADVVALQEVDRVWGIRSLFRDQAVYIADRLGMDFSYGATLDREPSRPGVGEYGIMILSRYPIVDSRFRLLPGEFEQRGVLVCIIDSPHGKVPVACTHLGLSLSDRQVQIADILAWMPPCDGAVLMGDFNAPPGSRELEPLYSRFFDVQAVTGAGDVGTYWHQEQWVRIDCIFVAPQWKPDYCVVFPIFGSDHSPVTAGVSPIGAPAIQQNQVYRQIH